MGDYCAAPPVRGCVGLSQVTCQLFPNVLIVPASCCPWACSGPWVSRKWMPQEQRNPIHGGWMWGPQRPFWSVSQTISQRVPAGLTPPSPLCGNLLANTLYWLPPSLPHLPHSLTELSVITTPINYLQVFFWGGLKLRQWSVEGLSLAGNTNYTN